MRWPLAMAILVPLVSWSAVTSANPFPYTARIHADNAHVRSGPGSDYYPTDHLARGTEVEVYRHDGNGWCAIRPPEGSFSWINADQLKMTGQPSIFEITSEDTPCYVGTCFSDARGVQHVRLRKGELVEVLGHESPADEVENAKPEWYKIAPPSGEFRWVHLKHVSGQLPHQEADVQSPDDVIAAAAAEPVAAESARGNPDQARDSLPRAQALVPEHEVASASPESGNEGLAGNELAQIDHQLSATVAHDPAAWRLDDLKSRVQVVIDTSPSDFQRDRARRLLGTIGQFQDIKRRYERLPLSAVQDGDGLHSISLMAESEPHTLSTPVGMGVRDPRYEVAEGLPYDGTGWLMPLLSQRHDIPQYALTDPNGQILQFVSPAPGVNLRRFERKEIGIIGRRGYIPHLRRPHLTAQRVVVLSRHFR